MKYIIHIGYPKAASTLLQCTLFSGQDPQIQPLSKDSKTIGDYQKSGGRKLYNKNDQGITYVNPFVFDATTVRESILSQQSDQAVYTCLSNESWAGPPYNGGVLAKEYADRLHKILPEAKILIIVRNHVDAIFSTYMQYLVRSKGPSSLEQFLTHDKHSESPFHTLSYYCYHNLVNYYAQLFGKDNIMVLPFEILQKSGQQEFFNRIYSFLNLEIPYPFEDQKRNEADYKKYIILRKMPFLNLFSRNRPIHGFDMWRSLCIRDYVLEVLQHLVPEKIIKKSISKDKEFIRTMIGLDIKASNHELQTFVKDDLKSLGYLF